MNSHAARCIVETLRAGVPSREVSRVLLVGREALLEQCQADMATVMADRKGRSLHQRQLTIRAPYGGGKSHFLSAVANVALERDFAVSQIVLSKETPFDRLHKVYESAAHAIELPGSSRRGFEDALMKIRPSSPEYRNIRDYVEAYLHPKLRYTFENYFREGDQGKRTQLYEDLAGSFLPMTTLRAMHRTNFGEAVRMKRRFLLKEDAPDYFRFLHFFVRAIGYNGWVLLLDEAELIAKLGIGSRAQAYLNLGLLLGLHPEERIDGLYTVSAFASAFLGENLLGEHGDLERAPEWLRDPRRNRPEDGGIVHETLRVLSEPPHHNLPAIDMDVARGVLETIEQLHGTGYEWDARLNCDYILDQTQDRLSFGNIRTTIRAAIEYLDITFQYGEPPEVLETHELDEGTLTEED